MNESTDGSAEPEPSADNRAPEGAIPPPLPTPVEIPPAPPQIEAPQPVLPKKPSITLVTGAAVVGLLQFILAIIVTGRGAQADNYSFRIGAILGTTALWPLIIIGLFSLGKIFARPAED